MSTVVGISARKKRRCHQAALLTLATAVICLAVGWGETAEAATTFVKTLPSPSLQDEALLKPILIARKSRARKRKRFRHRAAHRKRHAKKRRHKLAHGKPKKPAKASRKPDRKQAGLVCIGGRVKAKRCRCSGKATRHKFAQRVFGCKLRSQRIAQPKVLVSTPQLAIGGVSTTTSSPAAARKSHPNFVTGEVLVVMSHGTEENADRAIANKFKLEIAGRWSLGEVGVRLVRYLIRDRRTAGQLITALKGDARVVAPQLNYIYRPQTASSKIHPSELQYALKKIMIAPAHSFARGRGVRIAIIDSGIDATHPDLAGAVEATWNAVGDGTARPSGHATAIAGIIGSRGLARGVAPDATLLNVNVFEPSHSGQSAMTTTADLLRGIDWALSRRARILNMSLTGPHDPLLRRGIGAAHRNHAIIVAAAGNGGAEAPPAYPAAYTEVIAVTATDIADRLYSSANRGAYIAIAAPGVDILAPALGHAHELRTGTSFAAAHVSGVVALLLGRVPDLTSKAVHRALSKAAGDLGPPGRDHTFGAGRVNAYRSLVAAEKSKKEFGERQ